MLSYPNGRKETMTWTKRGLEESRTFADGTKYTNTYDSRSRLSKRTYNNGAVINYEYDAKGKLIRQYTQLSDSSLTFDEVTYTWNDTGLICIEKHTNGPSYLIQYDDYLPETRHWKYRIVEPNTLTEKSVAKLPTDYGMFESQWNVATHGVFADGDSVYLLPYNENAPGYRYQNQQVTAMDLPVTSEPAGNTKTKDNGRYGDFILVGNLLFYKDFSTPFTLDYEGPDWLYDALRSNYQYYQAWHDGKYILPKGIVFVEEYSRTDNLFAVEFEDGKPVKFIHREDVDEWVASQEGGFTLEQGMIYGSYYHALYKDGYLYSHFSPIYGKKYRNDVDAYVGSINDQFSIWEIYGGSYAITNKKGDLLTYFTVPKSETKKYNFDFNEKGQLYAVTTPEYTSKTHYYEDDYAIEYIFVEGSTGEIVTFNGYLESFGTFTADAVELKELPSDNAKNLGTYGADTTFFIMDTLTVPGNKKNAASTWYEVQLCDGTIGFVPESSAVRF